MSQPSIDRTILLALEVKPEQNRVESNAKLEQNPIGGPLDIAQK
jgi:hypothetical protein